MAHVQRLSLLHNGRFIQKDSQRHVAQDLSPVQQTMMAGQTFLQNLHQPDPDDTDSFPRVATGSHIALVAT